MSDDHDDLHSVPNPSDKTMEDWLATLVEDADEEFEEFFNEFMDVVKFGEENGDPHIFAYARLLNRLSELTQPKLIRILSGAIWVIKEAEEA